MNMAAAHPCLTVSEVQGQNASQSLDASRAGRRGPVIVGAQSATRGRFLLSGRFMAAGSGTPSGVPVLRPVREPAVIRHPIVFAGEVADSSTERRSPIMANANTPGAIRPNSTLSEIRWVKEATAVKRLRRHLATIGQQLVITKAGTWQRQHWGRMAIVEDTGEVYLKSVDLQSRLRAFGLMADDEQIEIEGRAWRFFVARHRVEIIDGRSVGYNDQVSREYTTRAAAEKAADRIGGEDLAIVGFDAGLVKGGTKNADR